MRFNLSNNKRRGKRIDTSKDVPRSNIGERVSLLSTSKREMDRLKFFQTEYVAKSVLRLFSSESSLRSRRRCVYNKDLITIIND